MAMDYEIMGLVRGNLMCFYRLLLLSAIVLYLGFLCELHPDLDTSSFQFMCQKRTK